MAKGLFLLLIFLNFTSAVADEFPKDQFKIEQVSNWDAIESNNDVTILRSKKLSLKDVVVLRVFEQTANSDARRLAFKNELHKINEARNKLFELIGIGNSNILEVNNLKLLNGNSVDGVEIESIFENIENKKIRIFERQYFLNDKIFQVTYSAYENTKVEKIRSILNTFVPKELRSPAAHSELAVSDNSNQNQSQKINRINDISLPQLMRMPVEKFDEAYCKHLPVEKKRSQTMKSLKDRYDIVMEARSLAALGGCMHGLWKAVKEMLVGLKDLSIGIYKYATDSVMREQVNAALAIVWSEFANNKMQFVKRLVANIYNYMVVAGGDFLCMNPVAQSETICKVAGYLLPPTTLTIKLMSRAKLAASEVKIISDFTKKAEEAVLKAKIKSYSISSKITQKKPIFVPDGRKFIHSSEMKKLGSEERNLYEFNPTPYQYVEDVEAAKGLPVFEVAGLNSTTDLRKIKTIAGEDLDELTRLMYGCKASWAKGVKGSCFGFLKDGEHLRDVLIKDNSFVQAKGLTHQEVASPLLKIMEEFEKTGYQSIAPKSMIVEWSGRKYEVIGNVRPEGNMFNPQPASSGWIGEANSNKLQGSPFKNDQIYNTWEFKIKDPKTGKVLRGEGLTPHLIYRYGFYQGGPFRLHPQEIIDFFNLSPN